MSHSLQKQKAQQSAPALPAAYGGVMFSKDVALKINKCSTCSITNIIFFWGDMPQRKWKRPTLFIICMVSLVGGSALFYVSEHPNASSSFTICLAIFIGLILLLGLIVSIVGCDKCVARALGSGRNITS